MRRSLALVAVAGMLVSSAPLAAHASPQTFKRSMQNILFAPLDFALAPIVAGQSWWSNWTDVDDSPGVHYTFAVPGVFWMTALQMGTSVLREVAGALELLPGLVLIPFEADADPIFDLAEENASLVDLELDGFMIRFGINYTSSSAAY
jgi:hypothetical protein